MIKVDDKMNKIDNKINSDEIKMTNKVNSKKGKAEVSEGKIKHKLKTEKIKGKDNKEKEIKRKISKISKSRDFDDIQKSRISDETAGVLAENKMREIKIEKVVLSAGGVADMLEKQVKLIGRISEMKVLKTKSNKRIPSLGVRPGLEVGCMATLRGKKAEEMLKRLLGAVDNRLKEKQFTDGSFSFGIKEYIEIPEMTYQRDIGMIGFEVSVSFKRAGKRIAIKRLKQGKLPKKQEVSKEEIMEFMKNKFNVELIGGKKEEE